MSDNNVKERTLREFGFASLIISLNDVRFIWTWAGGGSGGASIAICNKYPQIKATVADLPKVVQLAERFIAEAGMSDRVGVAATDLWLNSPEGKYNVAIMRAVIQTLSKEQSQMSLKCISAIKQCKISNPKREDI